MARIRDTNEEIALRKEGAKIALAGIAAEIERLIRKYKDKQTVPGREVVGDLDKLLRKMKGSGSF